MDASVVIENTLMEYFDNGYSEDYVATKIIEALTEAGFDIVPIKMLDNLLERT